MKILTLIFLMFHIPLEPTRLSENVLLFSMGSQEVNSTVVKTKAGLVIIDTNELPETAEEISAYITQKWKGDKVKYVINTHHHFDHVQGNQVFDDALIIAHKNCPAKMQAAADPTQRIVYKPNHFDSSIPPPPPAKTLYTDSPGYKLTLPNILVDDEYNFEFGETSFSIYYYGTSHTDNDLLIVIPDEGLLFVGDLFYKNYLPHFSDSYQPDVERWKAVIKKINTAYPELQTVISGHGKPFSFDLFMQQFKYLVSVYDETKKYLEEGFTEKEIKDLLSLDKRFGSLKELDIRSSKGGSLHEGNIKRVLDLLK